MWVRLERPGPPVTGTAVSRDTVSQGHCVPGDSDLELKRPEMVVDLQPHSALSTSTAVVKVETSPPSSAPPQTAAEHDRPSHVFTQSYRASGPPLLRHCVVPASSTLTHRCTHPAHSSPPQDRIRDVQEDTEPPSSRRLSARTARHLDGFRPRPVLSPGPDAGRVLDVGWTNVSV